MWALVLISVLIVIAVVICKRLYGASTAKIKGERGEHVVARRLGGTREGKQYLINDLLFKTQDGQSCQIDHVFICSNGIWVIETKNYSGLICGDETSNEWTQVLAGGHEKHKFYNPIKQNTVHVYKLSGILNARGIINGAVVFLSRADLFRVHAKGVYTERGIASIKKEKTGVSLSSDEMKNYYARLVGLKQSGEVTLEEHVDAIRKKKQMIESGVCPRCGGKLVLRKGKFGSFYGCSAYPQCKFTKNIREINND